MRDSKRVALALLLLLLLFMLGFPVHWGVALALLLLAFPILEL